MFLSGNNTGYSNTIIQFFNNYIRNKSIRCEKISAAQFQTLPIERYSYREIELLAKYTLDIMVDNMFLDKKCHFRVIRDIDGKYKYVGCYCFRMMCGGCKLTGFEDNLSADVLVKPRITFEALKSCAKNAPASTTKAAVDKIDTWYETRNPEAVTKPTNDEPIQEKYTGPMRCDCTFIGVLFAFLVGFLFLGFCVSYMAGFNIVKYLFE